MSDLENKVEEQAAEQANEQMQAVEQNAAAADDAPFLSDDEASSDAPFLSAEETAAAEEEQSKVEKDMKTARDKKKAAINLKGPVKKLEPMDPSEVEMRWYFIQAFSGYEQRVAQTLAERIKIHQMEDYFGEILVPREKVKDIKDGKRRDSERKFFPGYVMVEMKMTSDSWQLVKHTERVLGFIGGTPERPLPISKIEAERILNRLRETSEAPRPKTLFEVGEQVRATEGAFKDFSGTVESVDYEKSRLTVSIAIFGRATPVELEFGQVEKEV